MKIRIKSNTLRLRLTQTEVAIFLQTGKVKESIHFGMAPEDRLEYILCTAEIDRMEASFANHQIWVRVPKAMGSHWANRAEQVGMQGQMDIGTHGTLQLLIEKDFQCLKVRPGEDETDNFTNPNMA